MTINYVKGDATAPEGNGDGNGHKIIVHICNDIGGWGAGFVLAISKRWKQPEAEYRAWAAGEREDSGEFVLGNVQIVQVNDEISVANLIGQHDIKRKKDDPEKRPPIRYDAVAAGLATITIAAQELSASVHMPRIGCGLAGGKWEEIEPLILETLVAGGVDVTVYDF